MPRLDPSSPALTLLKRGDYWRIAAVGQLAALPVGMTPLAYTLLTASALGSYRVGSVLVTVGVLAQVVAAPLVGRLLDRVGVGRGLRALLAVAACGYGLLAAVGPYAPAPVLVVLAVVPALPGAAFAGGVRTAMSDALPAPLVSAAVAMNATLLEGTLIAGPLLAAGLAVLAPAVAVGGLAVAMAAAAALLPRTGGPGDVAGGPRTSLLRRAAFVRWLVGALGVGLLFGDLEVGALALAHRLHGGSGTAALLLAVLSGCSALAGLAYTAFGHRLRSPLPRRAAVLLAVMGCAMVAVAVAGSWPVAGAAVGVLGLCAAPLMTVQSLGAEAELPDRRRAEGFALLTTAQGVGYAAGSLAVAALPLAVAQTVGAVGPLVAGVVLVSRRRTSRSRCAAAGRPGRGRGSAAGAGRAASGTPPGRRRRRRPPGPP